MDIPKTLVVLASFCLLGHAGGKNKRKRQDVEMMNIPKESPVNPERKEDMIEIVPNNVMFSLASENENDIETVAVNSEEKIMANAKENSMLVKIEEDPYVKKNESFSSALSEFENESFFSLEFENESNSESFHQVDMEDPVEEIEQVLVEERIDPQQFVGDWKRTASPESQKQYQKMINDVLNTADINKKLGFIQNWGIIKKDPGELAKTIAGRLETTMNIKKDGDSLKVKPSKIKFPEDVPFHKMISRFVSKYAKTQNPEVWSSNPQEVSVATVNGPTKRVCGLKYTSRGVEFGFLQCVDNSNSETCTQFVGMKYSLPVKENNLLEQHFTVYYLKSPADFEMGAECPKIGKDLYHNKASFTLQCTKE